MSRKIEGPLMTTQELRHTEQFYIGSHTIEIGEFPSGDLRLILYRDGEFAGKVDFHPRAARQLANAILLRVGQGSET